MTFAALVALVAFAASAIASIVGFGIGSLLTPIFALRVNTDVAAAAVSIPHVVGTALRFWTMRRSVDRRVMLAFGLTSAAGGLTGALLRRIPEVQFRRVVAVILALLGGAMLIKGLSSIRG